MKYSILNNEITVFDTENFVPSHIFDCGQVFRYSNSEKSFKICAKKSISHLNFLNDRVIISTSDVNDAVKYFDLDRDYGEIKRKLKGISPRLDEALDFGKGIRILNQDPLEMIISFIISANNNIPRIKGIIERMCEKLGSKEDGYFAFPSLPQLQVADEAFFAAIGAGYRARYLVKTIDAIANGFELDMSGLSTAEARKKLCLLTGVGGKVADCILLFGYHRTDVFPMDVWSERIYRDFGYPEASKKAMADALVGRFGEMSGYVQQYLYYYYREKNII